VGAWISRTQRFPVVTTKVFHSVEGDPGDRGLAPERIRTQVAGSLRRLGLAHVDLYMIHEPDPATPLEQTLEAFSELVSHAVVGAVGACNVDRAYVESALEISARRGLVRLEWIQNEYNLLARDDALLSLCAAEGLGFTPFSPLCGGWLAGRYSRGLQPPPGSRMTLRPGPYEHLRTPHTFDALQAFERMATERGLTMATLALGWLLSEPRITAVVIGPRRPEHLRAPIDALGVSLDGPQREEIAAIFGGVAA
jgi:aryl-alcohol dehydrogenase-like predicted oxidoreductase